MKTLDKNPNKTSCSIKYLIDTILLSTTNNKSLYKKLIKSRITYLFYEDIYFQDLAIGNECLFLYNKYLNSTE